MMATKAIRAAQASPSDEFEAERPIGEAAFMVDVDGFEGPLDLLLELARRQKVDLARISILELANQYLEFVEAARKQRLELAADYLVMAAWLAYLKSRLLLPNPPKLEADETADLAEQFAERLRKLEQMRRAGEALINRQRLGRDVFARGAPEGIQTQTSVVFEASLFELLSSYAAQAQKKARASVRMKARQVWSLAEAREALMRMRGEAVEFTALDDWLPRVCPDPKMLRSARASCFAASLEMVREGFIDVRQDSTFAPIFIRARAAATSEAAA